MRRLALILVVVVSSAGCGDSTQDVAVERSGRDIAPDTIITKDGLSVDVYGPGNVKSIEQEAGEWNRPEVQREFERLRDLGFTFAAEGPVLMHGVAPDGRTADIVWLSVANGLGAEAGIVHVRVGDSESVETFLDHGTISDLHPETIGKGESGPDRAFGYNTCLETARGVYQACVAGCVHDGSSETSCRRSCLMSAVFVFLYCWFVSS